MSVWIAFFRGINVGGRHSLPMKDLGLLFNNLGGTGAKTYIQSGNVVFQSKSGDIEKLVQDVGSVISRDHGFKPRILVLSREELQQAVVANPFPQADENPKTLHLYFLTETPIDPDLDAMTAIKATNEQLSLIDKVFYLYAPDGIGRSKLAEKVEKLLGVDATARNWRTVSKVLELACG